jgi:hypothetical protein
LRRAEAQRAERPSGPYPDAMEVQGGAQGPASPEEWQRTSQVLIAEYSVLMTAMTAAWSASLTRTSLFLGVLSAAGVAFGFAAPGSLDQTSFLGIALAVLLLVLFLGVATFVRLVQVQRESMVYLVGMNRIRYFFQQAVPWSRPYFVLPTHDDMRAMYRSIGSGMPVRPPRIQLLHLTVQTQGIVGVVTSVVAAGCAAIAASPLGVVAPWVAAVVAFGITSIALFGYWRRSLLEFDQALQPLNPTPPEGVDIAY